MAHQPQRSRSRYKNVFPARRRAGSCGRHRLSQGTPLTFPGRNKGCWVPAQTYLDNASSYLRHARTRGAEHAEYISVAITFRVVLDLVSRSAKIIHPVFVTPVAVKIVRDDCMTRPGFRLRGDV